MTAFIEVVKIMKSSVYLDKLLKLRKNLSIKLITGFRGSGKLELLKDFIEHLKSEGVNGNKIIFINFEQSSCITDFRELYALVSERIDGLDSAYLIFYGIQKIKEWEKAINAFFLGTPVEIYIADSNEKFLTEKLFQLLPNNCDVLRLYPLSFSEYLKSTALDVSDLNLLEVDINSLFEKYLRFGGMPVMSKYPVEDGVLRRLLTGLLYESLLKDLTIPYSLRNSYLLHGILKYLAGNLSKPIKLKNLEKYFTEKRQVTTLFTLDNYLRFIDEVKFFKKIRRYDLKKEIFIDVNECFYSADTGLCNALLDFGCYNETALIKNVVYLELIRRGFEVYCPILGTMTADFFAVSSKKEICIQILPTEEKDISSKLLRPLHKLPNDVDKILISKTPVKLKKYVKNLTVTDFLLNDDYY